MNFYRWLRTQKHRDDPIGDLSRDILRDSRRKPSSRRGWRTFLEDGRACDGALEALEAAWDEYTYNERSPEKRCAYEGYQVWKVWEKAAHAMKLHAVRRVLLDLRGHPEITVEEVTRRVGTWYHANPYADTPQLRRLIERQLRRAK